MDLQEITELTRMTYNVCAHKYHDLFNDELAQKEFDRNILNNFAKYFQSNSLIYDMGCGPSGHIGYFIHNKGFKVIGVDICDQCIELAKNFHPTMKFLRMDMSNLDIKSFSADGIISYYSIIHTPKKYVDIIFSEYRRILKKRGKLLLTVKEGSSEGIIENFLESGKQIYFTYFTQEEIKGFLENNGFNILTLQNRIPLEEEIAVNRIYAIGEKI